MTDTPDLPPWEDSARPLAERAEALVAAAGEGRVALKRLAAWLERQDDALWAAVAALATARGVEVPDDVAAAWPAKKLLRRAQARAEGSQVRTTPIARDEAFTCMHCGRAVPAHGRTARDHCPWCLRGRHVDGETPGDRAADCGGRLDPFDVAFKGDAVVIRYHCTRCRAERVVRAVLDGDPPDDWEALVALSSGRLG